MSNLPAYANNASAFTEFRAAQRRLVVRLSLQPPLLQAWLATKPPRAAARAEAAGASRSWRSARLNSRRRGELAALIERSAPPAGDSEPLAAWLLSAAPVASYLEIAGLARPSLAALDPEAERCAAEVIVLRDRLFADNYGLAKAAAFRRRGEHFGDCLSAASYGLLDAIDRYVPGEGSARFGYFATYWIRYHLSRHTQKHGCVVSVPINQHRIGRRIERYVEERTRRGLPEPTAADIRANLAVGVDAYSPSRSFEVVSLHAGGNSGALPLEGLLHDPAPPPWDGACGDEVGERIRAWLRQRFPPATRVMLAYGPGVGSLAEAAVDYLGQFARTAQERLRRQLP